MSTFLKQKMSWLLAPVSLLALGHFTVDVYSHFITPILPLLAAKIGISLPMVGLLVAISGLSSSFLQPIYGFFSDNLSRRFFVVWGLIIAAGFISLTGLANSYLTLAVCVVLGNIGVGLYHPQATSIVGNLKTRTMSTNMGVFVGGGLIGGALSATVSATIVEFFGLNNTWIAVFPGIIVATVIYFLLPKIEPVVQRIKIRDVSAIIKKNAKELAPLISLIVIRALVMLALMTYLPFEWINGQGHSVITVGIVMSLASIFGGLFSFIGGNIANVIGERFLQVVSFVLSIPIMLSSLLLIQSNPLFSFMLFVLGFAIMGATISLNIVEAQRLVSQYKGVMSGITGGFCWGIAGLLMYPIGYFISQYGTELVLSSLVIILALDIGLLYLVPARAFKD